MNNRDGALNLIAVADAAQDFGDAEEENKPKNPEHATLPALPRPRNLVGYAYPAAIVSQPRFRAQMCMTEKLLLPLLFTFDTCTSVTVLSINL